MKWSTNLGYQSVITVVGGGGGGSKISFFPALFLAQLALYDSELLELIFSHSFVTKLEPCGGRSLRWDLFNSD